MLRHEQQTTASTRDVFLSYARGDTELASRLRTDLETRGFSVWMDTSGISGGEDWAQRIAGELGAARCVIVLLTPASLSSRWVRRELQFADEYGIRVLPVQAEDVSLPAWYRLRFGTVHYLDLRGRRYANGLDDLAQALRTPTDAVPAAARPRQTSPRRRPRATLLTMVVIGVPGVIALLIVTGIIDLSANPDEPAADSATPEETGLLGFQPFVLDGSRTGELKDGMTIAADHVGSCWRASKTALAGYRCSTNSSLIFDPCFLEPIVGDRVACPSAPWGDANIIFLTEALPIIERSITDPHNLPWALELVNGDRCVFLDGVGVAPGGERENYRCSSGGSLFGDPSDEYPFWSVRYGSPESADMELVQVARVWR